MKAVLAYGFPLDYNFGGPCVLHGLQAILRELYGDCRLIVYQPHPTEPVSVTDADFPVTFFPYAGAVKPMFRDWVRRCWFHRRIDDPARDRFWDDFIAADAVVNVFAINFCAALSGRGYRRPLWVSVRKAAHDFALSLLARLAGKLSVKSTSSYGPINSFGERLAAWFVCNFCFKRILARERSGRDELRRAGVWRRVGIAPDMANAMVGGAAAARARRGIGVSLSYMSERQWQGKGQSYVESMRGLLACILATTDEPITVFPNQTNCASGRDDIVVSEEIVGGIDHGGRITLFDVRAHGAREMRRAISECAALVSCRYHSCVAALSTGVPVMTIAWHDKYVTLMSKYGQSRWLVRSEDCTAEALAHRFGEFWNARADIAAEIAKAVPTVRAEVVESVAKLLGAGR